MNLNYESGSYFKTLPLLYPIKQQKKRSEPIKGLSFFAQSVTQYTRSTNQGIPRGSVSLSLQRDNLILQHVNQSLRAVIDLEFMENAGQMILDGLLR